MSKLRPKHYFLAVKLWDVIVRTVTDYGVPLAYAAIRFEFLRALYRFGSLLWCSRVGFWAATLAPDGRWFFVIFISCFYRCIHVYFNWKHLIFFLFTIKFISTTLSNQFVTLVIFIIKFMNIVNVKNSHCSFMVVVQCRCYIVNVACHYCRNWINNFMACFSFVSLS